MSNLTETQRAYSRIAQLLDQEIRKSRSSVRELEDFRKILDRAFYLLGWAQFEHLVRRRTSDIVEEKARSQSVEKYAWAYLKQNVRSMAIRLRLDIIFHSNPAVRKQLDKDYELRNDVAHENGRLPAEASDISAWLVQLENLVGRF